MRHSLLLVPSLAAVVVAGCGGSAHPALEPEARSDSVSYGYGRETRARSTGAVGSVTPRENDAPVSRIEELLDGRVAGVQVLRMGGGNYSIRIRGMSTLPGSGTSAEPLVILDGMPLESLGLGSVLNGINPHDVRRIEVLKDAGSTAIYGSRGANGVIIITTKRAP